MPDPSVTQGASDRQPHELLAMRDIVDAQLETLDDREIGRVADLVAERRADGSLWLTHIRVGPEALGGRIGRPVGRLLARLLGGRFDRRIELTEAEELGPTLRLRGRSDAYPHGGADKWIVDHIFRFIPGSGR